MIRVVRAWVLGLGSWAWPRPCVFGIGCLCGPGPWVLDAWAVKRSWVVRWVLGRGQSSGPGSWVLWVLGSRAVMLSPLVLGYWAGGVSARV
eukprot:3755834-Prymnesium_polylepis.2